MEPAIYYPKTPIAFDGWTVEIIRISFGEIVMPIPFHAHGRECYEFHYNASGSGTMFMEDERYDITPGSFYITGPGVRHAQLPRTDDPFHEYCINLSIHADADARERNDYLPNALESMRTFVCRDLESLSLLFTRLFTEYRQQRVGYEHCAKALLEEIVIAALRNNRALPKPPRTKIAISGEEALVTDTQRSLYVDQYFLDNYADQSLKGLAKALSLSTRQTQRLLNDYYGKSFSEKTLEARMNMASLLLAETQESISDIAYYAGYSSPAHFGYAFRSHYGMPASEYRKRARP